MHGEAQSWRDAPREYEQERCQQQTAEAELVPVLVLQTPQQTLYYGRHPPWADAAALVPAATDGCS